MDQDILDGILAPYVIFEAVRDDEGQILDFICRAANQAACEYSRLSLEQLVDTRLMDLLPGPLGSRLLNQFISVVESGEQLILEDFTYEDELLEHERRFDVRATKLGDGLSYSWLDVTERYESRRELEESANAAKASSALLRSTLDALLDPVIMVEPLRNEQGSAIGLGHVLVNEAACRYTLLTEEELLGRDVLSFVDPIVRDKALELALAAIEGREPVVFDDFMFFASGAPGEMRFVDIRGFPVEGSLVLTFRDVTEQHREAERLTRSQELFQLAFTSSVAGMCMTDPQGRLLNVNEVLCEMLGRSEAELRQLSWRDLIHPADCKTLEQDGAVVASGEEGHSWSEVRYLRTDGSVAWAEVALACTRDSQGRTNQFICQLFDVSEDREREMALRASNDRFARGLVESLVGVCIVTPQGQYVEVNEAFCRITGRSRGELMTMARQEVIHPDDLAINQSLSEQVAAGAMDSYRIQKRYLRPDGSIIWVEFSLSCARDEDGSVAYFLGQVLDVTAQRAQTEALRLSEQRFRQAMMNANVGVVVVDTSGRYQTVNQAFCDMVGCSEDEILGLSSASFTLPEEEEAQVQAVKKILAGEDESFRLFKRLRRVDGSLITTDISGTPIRDAEGRITSFVAHVVDITEQVEQARALQSSERRFRLLVERNSQVAFESDNNGVMTWISASVHQVIGYRPEEMVGRAFVDFVHPSDQSNLRGFQQGLIRGTGSEGELRVRTADGGWVKVAFSVGPLLDNDGVVEGRAGVWRDVSSIESPH